MFERPKSGDKAILVHVSMNGTPLKEELNEFKELARSAGATLLTLITGSRSSPDKRFFVGSGKAEEIKLYSCMQHADLVIFNHELSASQERNLEQFFECRVLDRTGLILDIFAQRARSHEGKLQVELAQLRHLSTRLIRGWTHLERQKGGIGLRGPGETQLETDRRLLNVRLDQLKRRLSKVDSQREQSRRARQKTETPTACLVGYTNTGKSTLFNTLTNAQVLAKDQLFATLDPTLRRLELSNGNPLVLADTVGFVSKLPHDLVAAFKSTLQETIESNLLLHVIDVASPTRDENMKEVEDVLEQIGAAGIPKLLVYNKIDLFEDTPPRIDRDKNGRPFAVWISASKNVGIDALQVALAEIFEGDKICCTATLEPADGRLHALLFERGKVLDESITDRGGWELKVELYSQDYERLRKTEPKLGNQWKPLALSGGEFPIH
tara:strand:+ start:6559 stop:7875 length:1317 start_codon:yes stop_codon:yes gene_type:complete